MLIATVSIAGGLEPLHDKHLYQTSLSERSRSTASKVQGRLSCVARHTRYLRVYFGRRGKEVASRRSPAYRGLPHDNKHRDSPCNTCCAVTGRAANGRARQDHNRKACFASLHVLVYLGNRSVQILTFLRYSSACFDGEMTNTPSGQTLSVDLVTVSCTNS